MEHQEGQDGRREQEAWLGFDNLGMIRLSLHSKPPTWEVTRGSHSGNSFRNVDGQDTATR